MDKNFIYHVPTKLYVGREIMTHLGDELARYGRKVLLIYGSERIKSTELYKEIAKEAQKASLQLFEQGGVEPNPRHSTVNRMADFCKKEGVDVLLAVGGGSVMDCAKFVSAATYYDGDCWDFFSGKAKMEKFLPLLTVPTLSGTGSDMDAFGIVSNEDRKEKLPLYHPELFPKVSFLDPTLTYSVSPFQTACGAIDAFSHYLEVYLCAPIFLCWIG